MQGGETQAGPGKFPLSLGDVALIKMVRNIRIYRTEYQRKGLRRVNARYLQSSTLQLSIGQHMC
jgi:hypothetical protein